MFENVKKEPEDIFAGSEGAVPTPPPPVALAGQSLSSSREISSSPISSEQTREKQTSHWSWKMIGIVGMAIVIVAVAGVLSSRILASRTKSSDRVPSVQTDEEKMQELKKETEKIPKTTSEQNKPQEQTSVIFPTPIVVPEPDADKDGLSDAQEAEIGTSPTNADTDGDGLFDQEEVAVYKTNPLNPDTDGDTYLDGKEVSSGYNPNGSGKLFTVPTEVAP